MKTLFEQIYYSIQSVFSWLGTPLTVLTLSAPTFLWLGSGLLFLSFALVSIKYKHKAARIVNSLKLRAQEIALLRQDEQFLDGRGLEELRLIIARDERLKDIWNEFEETLLVYPDGRIYNTRQAEEFFSEENLISTKINSKFYSAYPGLLTSVGLLFTFMAILIGLHGIHEDGGKIAGVEQLVFSLSGKFISSITALLCAALFIWLDKTNSKKLSGAYQRFVGAINKRLTRMPAEKLLHEMQDHIKEQANAIRSIATDLAVPITQSLQEGMAPLVGRIAEALDELKKQKNESFAESLGPMLNEFKNSLMGSTNNEFKALAESIQSTASLLSEMNETQKQTQRKTEEMISAFDSLLEKQAQSAQEQSTRLSQTMDVILEKLSSQAEQSSSALGSSVQSLLERLTETTSNQMLQQNKQTQEISSALSSLLARINESSKSSSTTMQSSIQSVLEQTSNLSSATSEKIIKMMGQQAANAETLSEARETLKDSVVLFKDAVQGCSAALSQIDSGSNGIQEGLTTLETSIRSSARIQESTSNISALAETNLRELTKLVTNQKEVLENYERVFSTLDRNIGGILEKIGEQLNSYSQLVKSGLENHLSQFDTILGNATGRLNTTVRGLGDSLDTLTEIVERTNRNAS